MSGTTEESLSSESLRRHVVRIAEEMAEPWKWRLSHIDCCDENEHDHCVCGARIKWRFIIVNDEEPERELTIGSTCIEATVPWLVSMNAEALATAIRTQWAQVVAEIRRARLMDQGLQKLKPTLALAAVLNDWFWQITEAAGIDQIGWWWMPEYWRDYREDIGKRLLSGHGDTPARHAASLLRRISNFRDRAPLLREALRKAGKDRCWSDPPTAGSPDVDVWYELWLAAGSLRRTLSERKATDGETLDRLFPDFSGRFNSMLALRLPVTIQGLRSWIAGASLLLSSAPTEEQMAVAKAEYEGEVSRGRELERRLRSPETDRFRLLFPAFYKKIEETLSAPDRGFNELRARNAAAEALTAEMPNPEAVAAAEVDRGLALAEYEAKRLELQAKLGLVTDFFAEYAERLAAHLRRPPFPNADALRAWCAEAEAILDEAPPDTEIEAARHIKEVKTAKQRFIEAENELTRLRDSQVEREELLRSRELMSLTLRERKNPNHGSTEYVDQRGSTVYKYDNRSFDRSFEPGRHCLFLIGDTVFDNGHIRIILVRPATKYKNLPDRISKQISEVARLKAELAALSR